MKTDSLALPTYPATGALMPFWLQRLDPGDRRAPVVALIEDDVTIALMYRTQLEADGFEVRVSTDGASGLHSLQQSPPDLVLLDIRLPKRGGLEVLKAVAGDPRLAGIPVLILSNHSDPGTMSEAMSLGAKKYLVKSQTTPSQLVNEIRDHLSER